MIKIRRNLEKEEEMDVIGAAEENNDPSKELESVCKRNTPATERNRKPSKFGMKIVFLKQISFLAFSFLSFLLSHFSVMFSRVLFVVLAALFFISSNALISNRVLRSRSSSVFALKDMVTIANGVQFDTIAREWRMKWSPDNDKVCNIMSEHIKMFQYF